MKTETWYVMEDGSCGDPREIAAGADGVLRHTDGRAVAYRPDGVTPRSRGVDADSARKDMQPAQPGPGYMTRESQTGRGRTPRGKKGQD